jgi:hypothetical protein
MPSELSGSSSSVDCVLWRKIANCVTPADERLISF